jgi:hypothetical protein
VSAAVGVGLELEPVERAQLSGEEFRHLLLGCAACHG